MVLADVLVECMISVLYYEIQQEERIACALVNLPFPGLQTHLLLHDPYLQSHSCSTGFYEVLRGFPAPGLLTAWNSAFIHLMFILSLALIVQDHAKSIYKRGKNAIRKHGLHKKG